MCPQGTIGVSAGRTDEDLAKQLRYGLAIVKCCVTALRERDYNVVPLYQGTTVPSVMIDFKISKTVTI